MVPDESRVNAFVHFESGAVEHVVVSRDID